MRINEAGDSIAQRVQGQGGISASEQPASASSAAGAKPSARTRANHLVPDDAAHPMPTGMKLLSLYIPLIPSILGLCFARAGLIVAGYGSYTHTDEGIFTDGAMLVALAIMSVILAVIGTRKIRLKKRTTNRIMRTCVVLETLCVLALPLVHLAGGFSPKVHFWLCVAVTFFGSFAIFYWLRRARGCGSTTAVLYVFSALAISEVEIYICSLIGTYGFYLAAALALLQFPCMLGARKNKLANDIESFTPNDDFFGFATTLLSSKRFLTATATSIGVLSIVDGFLRGYPDGTPIAFQPITRIAYGLLTIAICCIIICMMMRKRKSVMTVGMFILMELLACAALVLYAAFPGMPDIGAVFTTTLNALLVAFAWYIIIAFMSFGWRDPYYYALGGWIVWLGCRAIARVTLMNVQSLSTNDLLINAIMGTCVVISTQVALGQFLKVSQLEADERHDLHVRRMERLEKQLARAQANVEALTILKDNAGDYSECSACANATPVGAGTASPLQCAGITPVENTEPDETTDESSAAQPDSVHGMRLVRLMGLDEGDSIADIRKATMRSNAEQMGKQFLLSDREVEVLAFYALGWTQKRVAEELYISPSTAHAHIKRIYAKTGLHSRQEILDFMDQYTS